MKVELQDFQIQIQNIRAEACVFIRSWISVDEMRMLNGMINKNFLQ
jgi:hypothetical protein